MSAIDNIIAPIVAEMKEFEPFFRSNLKTNVPLLNTITNYILRRKGKQMRPMLVFLSAKLFNNVNVSTYTAASLIELLHTASLVHDDVVDNSNIRRGVFSVKALWKSKIAVLVGDFFLSKGLLISVENNAYDLLKIVSEAVKEMAEGELLQLEKARKLNITEEIYYEIISKKTAALIAACSACGSKSAGCDDETVKKMKEFGKNLGIAFQIKDDLFDYQEKDIFGKPKGNDIHEKKITLPLIHALNASNSSAKSKILRIISKSKKNQNDINTVVKFVTENGGIEYTKLKMTEFKKKSEDLLKDFPENPAKKSLLEYVDYAINREI